MIRPASCVLVGLLGVVATIGCGGTVSTDTDQTSNAGAGGSGLAGSAGAGTGGAGVGGSHQAGTGGVAGTGGAAGSTSQDIVGSYDVTFGAVTQDHKPLGQNPPSPGTSARLDIRATGSGHEAVVTPRFGAPAPMTVQVTGTTVVLDGSAMVSGSSVGSAIDAWKTFTLGRAPSGGLDGTASLVGEETAYGGDVADSTPIKGVATVGPDVTAPTLRVVSPMSLDVPGSMLPWEAITVNLSEGIRESTTQLVENAVEVRDAGKALPGVALLSPDDKTPGSWAGATGITLSLASWDIASAGSYGTSMLDIVRVQPLLDPTGNAAEALAAQVKVVAVPPALPSHGFDGDVVTTQLWGHTTLLGGGITGQSDPLCEQIGCLAFGPMDMGYCAKETAGAAARVKITSATTAVTVRFRVMAAEPSTSLPALQVKVVSHGGLTRFASSMVTLTETKEDSALPYASPWSTLTVDVPEGAVDEVGVSVTAGTNTACGFTPPATAARVLIEKIEAS